MTNTLKNYRRVIDKTETKLRIYKTARRRFLREISDLRKELATLEEVRDIFQKSAILTQNHLAKHLSSIVTKSLRVVWQDSDISFHTEFVERRNTTECEFYIEEEGHHYSLLDSRGYGVVDVVSFSLKIAYILLHTVENIIIIDEPARNLSKNKHEALSMLIKELSEELNVQFIIATHVPDLIQYADTATLLEKNKSMS